jgi:hypothetical protein
VSVFFSNLLPIDELSNLFVTVLEEKVLNAMFFSFDEVVIPERAFLVDYPPRTVFLTVVVISF